MLQKVVLIYQQVSPHIAVTEVAMPVDCWGKLLHPLDLPQQLSHLDCPVTSYFYLDYPVTSAFSSFFRFVVAALLSELSGHI